MDTIITKDQFSQLLSSIQQAELPFEHVAYAAPGKSSGNFHGWVQYRKQFEGESER